MSKTITHDAKIGDIFRMSWGYDQTNVDYFQVVGLTPKGVVVREIDHEKVEGTEGFMCSKVRPVPNKFSTLTMWVKDNVKGLVRKVGQSGGNLYISFGKRYCASRVRPDETTYNSWYA